MIVNVSFELEDLMEFAPGESTPKYDESISVFSMPDRLKASTGPEGLRIQFSYPGGEVGDKSELLDAGTGPRVWVQTAPMSGKIMELWTDPVEVTTDLLREIGRRVEERALKFPRNDRKFAFQMTGRVLDHWAEQILGGPPRVPAR